MIPPLFGDVNNTIAIWTVKVKSLSILTSGVRLALWTQFYGKRGQVSFLRGLPHGRLALPEKGENNDWN